MMAVTSMKPKLKTYSVTLRFDGKIHIVVQAQNENEALDLAIINCNSDHIESWEPSRGQAEVVDDSPAAEAPRS
jgi:hypothetical protein